MKTSVSATINGVAQTFEVEPRTSLADVLREQMRLTATHLGCEHGVCGACTVLIDGQPARSCIALAITLDGAAITTLEGLADDPLMQTLKASFHDQHGLQCGFCTPGMLMSGWDLLNRKPDIQGQDIRVAMSGNLCRCTGYQGIVRSIEKAAQTAKDSAAQGARADKGAAA